MGTLIGHLAPGAFFMTFGFWWSLVTSIRLVISKNSSPIKKRNKIGFHSTVTMPCFFLPCSTLRHAPVESWLKLIVNLTGIFAEIFTGTYKTINFPPGNYQHITMYMVFMIGAIIEILMYHDFFLPKRIDYVMSVIGFSIEALLFVNHIHGRDMLDMHLHTYLVYAIYGCVVTSTLEAIYPRQIIFTYGRILFVILQGTWFWEIGFILYPPFDSPKFKWEHGNHDQIMIVTASFCWHFMIILMSLICQAMLMRTLYRYSFKMRKYFEHDLFETGDYQRIELDEESITQNENRTKYFSLASENEEESV